MMLRSRKKNQNDVSLNDSIGTDKEGNAIMLMDVIENDDEDIFEEIQSGDRIKTLYKNIKYNLTPRERKIITLRYGPIMVTIGIKELRKMCFLTTLPLLHPLAFAVIT